MRRIVVLALAFAALSVASESAAQASPTWFVSPFIGMTGGDTTTNAEVYGAAANPFGLDLARFEFWRASAGLVVTF